MERASSLTPRGTHGGFSCWGCLKLKLALTKRRIRSNESSKEGVGCDLAAALRIKKPKPFGGFSYDPLSYAQNFDDGDRDGVDENTLSRGFSSRYAVPSKIRKE